MSFRLYGISVNINFYFLAAVSVLLMLDRSGMAALCVVSSLLHEAGHLAALALMKASAKEIGFKIGAIQLQKGIQGKRSYKRDAIAAFSGPFFNMLAFGALYFLYYYTGNSQIQMAAIINLVVGLFNLLPIASLDGGLIIYSALCLMSNQQTALTVLKALSVATLLPTAAAGFYFLIKSGYNATLLITCIYLTVLLLKNEME